MRFRGFPAQAFEFYARLGADNSRQYWAANRDVYETCVRGPLQALLDDIAAEFCSGPVSVFRPNRDIRFSADKSPYKTHQGGFAGSPTASDITFSSMRKGCWSAAASMPMPHRRQHASAPRSPTPAQANGWPPSSPNWTRKGSH